eukprot:UN03977
MDELEPHLPKMAAELADILGMPEKYVNPIDTMYTEVGPLVMFEHPTMAKLDPDALDELVKRMKDTPGLENLGLANEIPFDFLFPVADADRLEPLKDELQKGMACACVCPGIARESDELPELANDYYKVPPPVDAIGYD